MNVRFRLPNEENIVVKMDSDFDPDCGYYLLVEIDGNRTVVFTVGWTNEDPTINNMKVISVLPIRRNNISLDRKLISYDLLLSEDNKILHVREILYYEQVLYNMIIHNKVYKLLSRYVDRNERARVMYENISMDINDNNYTLKCDKIYYDYPESTINETLGEFDIEPSKIIDKKIYNISIFDNYIISSEEPPERYGSYTDEYEYKRYYEVKKLFNTLLKDNEYALLKKASDSLYTKEQSTMDKVIKLLKDSGFKNVPNSSNTKMLSLYTFHIVSANNSDTIKIPNTDIDLTRFSIYGKNYGILSLTEIIDDGIHRNVNTYTYFINDIYDRIFELFHEYDDYYTESYEYLYGNNNRHYELKTFKEVVMGEDDY